MMTLSVIMPPNQRKRCVNNQRTVALKLLMFVVLGYKDLICKTNFAKDFFSIRLPFIEGLV